MSLLLDFIFPRICAHCHLRIEGKGNLLCSHCAEQIELIKPYGRCRICFAEKMGKICRQCQKRPTRFHRFATLFERMGSQETLLVLYQRGQHPQIYPVLASYALIQIERLGWHWPDIILYQQIALSKRILGRRSPEKGIAEALARLIRVPVMSELYKGDLTHKRALYIGKRCQIASFPATLYGLSID